jgi:hypothetical protein
LRYCIATALTLLIAGSLSATAQVCTIDQRLELAKAGYDKAEVETLCAAQSANAPSADSGAAQPAQSSVDARTPLQVLAEARYDGEDAGTWSRIYHSRNKCEFLADSIKINNNVKTFGGYYSKVIPYKKFAMSTGRRAPPLQFDADKGVLSASLSLTAYGFGTANQTCYAYLARGADISPADMPGLEREVRAEFESVRSALTAMGVDTLD